MLIINNRFLSLYDYNFLLVIQKIFSPPIPGFFLMAVTRKRKENRFLDIQTLPKRREI